MIGSGGVYGSTTKPLVNHETIVIGRKGSAGSVFYSPTPCHPSDTTFYLVWKEEVHVPFVYNFLLFKGIAPDRSVIPSLQRGDVESIVIPFPPLPEQRAIAHILRAVQAAREARQREVSLERERKAALMAHLFTHGTRGEPTKQTPIGEMPVSWEVKELGEVSDIRYGLGQPPELAEDGVPMIRATDIKAGRIVSEGVVRAKREAIPGGRNPFLEVGDIIVVRSGAYTGDVAVYDGRWESAIVGYDLVARPRNEQANSVYVASFLLSERGARYFRSQRDRAAQPHLNAEQLRKAVLPFPPPTEQKEVADMSKACDAKIAALERESALLDELFRALLEELMTGRVLVAGVVEDGKLSPMKDLTDL